MKSDNDYITDEERQEFRANIGQYLRPQQDKDDHGGGFGRGFADGQKSASYAGPVFSADEGIRVDRRDNPHADDEFKRAGLQQAKMAKLKAGKLNSGRELDLHGMYVADAARAITEFINQAYADGYECVKVIHGKGSTSGRGDDDSEADLGVGGDGLAVLKRYLIAWLKANDVVLAFCRALPQDGGGGASYILLSRS